MAARRKLPVASPPKARPAAPGASMLPDLAPELARELALGGEAGAGPVAQRPSAGAIARTLQEIAELLQLTGANTFKVRAYENASRALGGLGEDLDGMIESGHLVDVPGIGSSIAEKVTELRRTGRLAYLDELRGQVPAGLLALLRIPGLGPKKALALHDGLEIASVEELEAACRAGRLSTLKGFGQKTAENILLGIEQLRRVQGVFPWSFAHAVVEPIVASLRANPAVRRLEFAGSLRRRKETVHDVDIVLATDDSASVMEAFATGSWAARVLGQGETKTSVVHPSGLQIDLRAVTDVQYPYALHHFTGSKQHNIAMRGRAIRMGLKMNEYGLFRGEELVPCSDETAIFAALGLGFVPPELREDQGEIEAAETGALPMRLLEPADLRGALHAHTTASGGRSSLEELVHGARALGWEYIGLSDHAPGGPLTAAGDAPFGLLPPVVAGQRRAIADLGRAGIRVFHGVEVEIRPDGTLGAEDGFLAGFDFVIASVHADFGLSRDDATRRLLRAVGHPLVTILGHPTGRILLHRPAMEVDLAAVCEAAARHGVAVEIASHPQRMDLDGAGARLAREQGALVCIGPDAHDAAGLSDVRFGVGSARRGWLEPRHVLNTRSAAELAAHLETRRAAWRA